VAQTPKILRQRRASLYRWMRRSLHQAGAVGGEMTPQDTRDIVHREEPPWPGSTAARAMGCVCPVADNHDLEGVPGRPRVMVPRCPLHGQVILRARVMERSLSLDALGESHPTLIPHPAFAEMLAIGTEQVSICRCCGCVSIVGQPRKCSCPGTTDS